MLSIIRRNDVSEILQWLTKAYEERSPRHGRPYRISAHKLLEVTKNWILECNLWHNWIHDHYDVQVFGVHESNNGSSIAYVSHIAQSLEHYHLNTINGMEGVRTGQQFHPGYNWIATETYGYANYGNWPAFDTHLRALFKDVELPKPTISRAHTFRQFISDLSSKILLHSQTWNIFAYLSLDDEIQQDLLNLVRVLHHYAVRRPDSLGISLFVRCQTQQQAQALTELCITIRSFGINIHHWSSVTEKLQFDSQLTENAIKYHRMIFIRFRLAYLA